mmetsp:Transcript_11117/g.29793  ORF Transcript_11117/g.29793 Transcript_11117/m.29793 type:complete len:951 (+) Transcript_11117:337-3189(+)
MRTILVATALGLAATHKAVSAVVAKASCSVDDASKSDCGFIGIDQGTCESKGCCWAETSTDGTPWCFFGDSTPTSSSGYTLSADYKLSNSGLKGTLMATGDDIANYLQTLDLSITFESADTARVQITDAANERWTIPESLVPAGDFEPLGADEELQYELSFTNSTTELFTFALVRKADGAVLFDSAEAFRFEDQYIELSTALPPTNHLFGVGEYSRSTGLPLVPGSSTTLWARDMAAANFDTNLYGSHPFYVSLSAEGKAHGAFLRNSNGMDVVYGANADSLTFKVIGGVVDLFVFAGTTPAMVAAQYQSVVGKPAMMPYWSLGFHQCKYGYQTVGEVEEVWQNYTAAKIPLDTVWMDIDYMEAWKDWTLDPANFPTDEVTSFVEAIHDNGQHFVVIVDPGILAVDDSWDMDYAPFTDGLEMDLFVKDGFNREPYMTQVWPGPTVMPDWFHPNTSAYWTDSIATFHETLKFDGLWTDMNEVSNFCNDNGLGQVCVNPDPANCPTGSLDTQTICCLECTTVDEADAHDFPTVYQINNDAKWDSHAALGHKTLPMSAIHTDGERDILEYDVHNLFGMMEARLTAEALAEVRGARPFVVSRSSFPSHGSHAAHWTGDNAATWDDLKVSSVTIMNMALYGIPMVGSDICGFIDDTTEELCARWIEVGAFHPFSRNHNTLGAMPQELYRWDSVAEAARAALSLRYQLLPVMYTSFYRAQRAAELVVRPLWLNYPSEAETHAIDDQFMLDDAVLVSPALAEGQTSVRAYFPAGPNGGTKWYSLFDHSVVEAGAGWLELDTPLTSTNVHVASGSILPMHDTTTAMTVPEARAANYALLVAAGAAGSSAQGDLFIDDGEQVELTASTYVTYAYTQTESEATLVATVAEDGYPAAAESEVGSVVILGVPASFRISQAVVTVGDDQRSVEFNSTPLSDGSLEVSIDLNVATNAAFNLQLS